MNAGRIGLWVALAGAALASGGAQPGWNGSSDNLPDEAQGLPGGDGGVVLIVTVGEDGVYVSDTLPAGPEPWLVSDDKPLRPVPVAVLSRENGGHYAAHTLPGGPEAWLVVGEPRPAATQAAAEGRGPKPTAEAAAGRAHPALAAVAAPASGGTPVVETPARRALAAEQGPLAAAPSGRASGGLDEAVPLAPSHVGPPQTSGQSEQSEQGKQSGQSGQSEQSGQSGLGELVEEMRPDEEPDPWRTVLTERQIITEQTSQPIVIVIERPASQPDSSIYAPDSSVVVESAYPVRVTVEPYDPYYTPPVIVESYYQPSVIAAPYDWRYTGRYGLSVGLGFGLGRYGSRWGFGLGYSTWWPDSYCYYPADPFGYYGHWVYCTCCICRPRHCYDRDYRYGHRDRDWFWQDGWGDRRRDSHARSGPTIINNGTIIVNRTGISGDVGAVGRNSPRVYSSASILPGLPAPTRRNPFSAAGRDMVPSPVIGRANWLPVPAAAPSAAANRDASARPAAADRSTLTLGRFGTSALAAASPAASEQAREELIRRLTESGSRAAASGLKSAAVTSQSDGAIRPAAAGSAARPQPIVPAPDPDWEHKAREETIRRIVEARQGRSAAAPAGAAASAATVPLPARAPTPTVRSAASLAVGTAGRAREEDGQARTDLIRKLMAAREQASTDSPAWPSASLADRPSSLTPTPRPTARPASPNTVRPSPSLSPSSPTVRTAEAPRPAAASQGDLDRQRQARTELLRRLAESSSGSSRPPAELPSFSTPTPTPRATPALTATPSPAARPTRSYTDSRVVQPPVRIESAPRSAPEPTVIRWPARVMERQPAAALTPAPSPLLRAPTRAEDRPSVRLEAPRPAPEPRTITPPTRIERPARAPEPTIIRQPAPSRVERPTATPDRSSSSDRQSRSQALRQMAEDRGRKR